MRVALRAQTSGLAWLELRFSAGVPGLIAWQSIGFRGAPRDSFALPTTQD